MIDVINHAWNWTGITAKTVIDSNDFGNVIIMTTNAITGEFVEELSCQLIASDQLTYKRLLTDSEFLADWNMKSMVRDAQHYLGPLQKTKSIA
ncbi:MAG: hypothetical protein R3301_16695 [Saprospiraceae bacterium]|nr:hypothetical protein [Saprospiraceae bacterium]